MKKRVQIAFGTIYGVLGFLLCISILCRCSSSSEYKAPQEIVFPTSDQETGALSNNAEPAEGIESTFTGNYNSEIQINPYENPYSRPYLQNDEHTESTDTTNFGD